MCETLELRITGFKSIHPNDEVISTDARKYKIIDA